MVPRRLVSTLFSCVLLLAGPLTVLGQTAAPSGHAPVNGGRALAYQEISVFTASPNSRGEEAPILSDDGQRVAFAMAPGTEDPATPDRILVMNADGSEQREVDSYPSLCFCGSAIDLSADGGTVVSTDSVQLRVAGASGGRELIALASNEINAARISGDGATVFFRVYRDTTTRSSGAAVERGIWAINADGSDLRQLVNPRQLEALGLPQPILSAPTAGRWTSPPTARVSFSEPSTIPRTRAKGRGSLPSTAMAQACTNSSAAFRSCSTRRSAAMGRRWPTPLLTRPMTCDRLA